MVTWIVTLDRAMNAIEMVLNAGKLDNGDDASDYETCSNIEWDYLEDLLKEYTEGNYV